MSDGHDRGAVGEEADAGEAEPGMRAAEGVPATAGSAASRAGPASSRSGGRRPGQRSTMTDSECSTNCQAAKPAATATVAISPNQDVQPRSRPARDQPGPGRRHHAQAVGDERRPAAVPRSAASGQARSRPASSSGRPGSSQAMMQQRGQGGQPGQRRPGDVLGRPARGRRGRSPCASGAGAVVHAATQAAAGAHEPGPGPGQQRWACGPAAAPRCVPAPARADSQARPRARPGHVGRQLPVSPARA